MTTPATQIPLEGQAGHVPAAAAAVSPYALKLNDGAGQILHVISLLLLLVMAVPVGVTADVPLANSARCPGRQGRTPTVRVVFRGCKGGS